MKEAVYNVVYEAVSDRDSLRSLQSQFDQRVSYDTLLAIWSLKYRKHSMEMTNVLRMQGEYLYLAYLKGSTLLQLAKEKNAPPYILARVVVQHMAVVDYIAKQGASIENPPPRLDELQRRVQHTVHSQLRNLELLPESIRGEVEACLRADEFHSEQANIIRRVTGREFEYRLKNSLMNRGIPFIDEQKMRELGYSKTPDAHLALPCIVKGRVVHWLESKASFGDRQTHLDYVREQYITYYNRFGTGLVIYWRGFIDELDAHKEFLILDHFPADIQVLRPALTL